MKKLSLIAAILVSQTFALSAQAGTLSTSGSAEATAPKAAKPLNIHQQVELDAQRDPYAETTKQPIRYELQETTVIEGYQAPAAAASMQPSKVFKVKNGNIVVKQDK
jgi:hypothetical protein